MPRQRDLPLSLDLLRGFEAAARLLSFTAAASELFVTQSAVSRQVQQLEEQLGVKLFERRTRALVLTEAGALYFREVSKALHLLREVTATVRASVSTCSVGASTSCSDPPAIDWYNDARPLFIASSTAFRRKLISFPAAIRAAMREDPDIVMI